MRGLLQRLALTVCAAALAGCGGGAGGVRLDPGIDQPSTIFSADGLIKAVVPPGVATLPVELALRNASAQDGAVGGPEGRTLLMAAALSATITAAPDAGEEGAAGAPKPGDSLAELAMAVELTLTLQQPLPAARTLPVYRFNSASGRYEDAQLSGVAAADGLTFAFSVQKPGRYAIYSLLPAELPPPAPQGLALLAASTQVRRLSWEAVAGAAGYNLYRAPEPEAGVEPAFSKVNSAPLLATQYSDELTAPGGCIYQVTAVSAEGPEGALESLPSARASSPDVRFDVAFSFGALAGGERPADFAALALDSAGDRLFATDPAGDALLVYSLDGSFLGRQTRYGNAQAADPRGLWYDAGAGLLYLTDSGLDSVFILNAGTPAAPRTLPYSVNGRFGTRGSAPGEFERPGAVALFGQQLLVADETLGSLQVFTARGVYLRTLAQSGAALGQLDGPSALLPLRAGGFIAAEAGLARLTAFSAEPAADKLVTLPGLDGGPLTAPRALCEDFRGRVYVADSPSRRVVVLDSALEPLFNFGSSGSFIVEFGERGPTALALDPLTGLLYVADPSNRRILAFTS